MLFQFYPGEHNLHAYSCDSVLSETDRPEIDDIHGEEIGARFPSVREARRDTRPDGMDILDCVGEGMEDSNVCSQGRLKLANGRKRTRYREV